MQPVGNPHTGKSPPIKIEHPKGQQPANDSVTRSDSTTGTISLEKVTEERSPRGPDHPKRNSAGKSAERLHSSTNPPRAPRKSLEDYGHHLSKSKITSSNPIGPFKPYQVSSTGESPPCSSPSSSGSPRSPRKIRKLSMGEPSEHHISIGLPTVINLIKPASINFSIWRDKVISELIGRISNESNYCSVNEEVNSIFNECLTYSNILNRIEFAIKLFDGVNAYNYLNHFSDVSHPIKFAELLNHQTNKHLSKDPLFLGIIGGNDSLEIIDKCVEDEGSKIKKIFKSAVDAHLFSEAYKKKLDSLLKFSACFHEKFDQQCVDILPVFLLNYDDFKKNSRLQLFYFDKFVSRGNILLNDDLIYTPNLKEENKKERERLFAEWLFKTLTGFVNKNTKDFSCSSDDSKQLKIFAETPLDNLKFKKEDLKNLITLSLIDFFDEKTHRKNICVRFILFVEKLEKEKAGSDFAKHMRTHNVFVSKYLEFHVGFQNGSWNEVSEDLIDVYCRLYNIHQKYASIPCLPIFKAVLDNGETESRFLKNVLCPGLFKKNSSHELRLTPESLSASTCYDIRCSNNVFRVTQIQSYQILSNMIVRANFLLHWVVRGELSSFDYSAELQIDEWQLTPECSKEEGVRIMNFFDMEFEQTSWKHFVVKRIKSMHPKVQFALSPHTPKSAYAERKI